MIATRGQSGPVLEYQIGVDTNTGDPLTTRGGTAGVYTNPAGSLITGASLLGNVNNTTYPANPDLSFFQVPGTAAGTRFDQFPGSPSPTDGNTIVFKGNWTEGATGKTGVYFRDVLANGGQSFVQRIADSNTLIPGESVNFGSTAPPSAANGRAVFVGLDNEAAPTKGGIYLDNLDDGKDPNLASPLTSIANIGGAAAGTGMVFSQLGEGLSFDGQHVAYWGALGTLSGGGLVTATRSITVDCASIENNNMRGFCLSQDDGSVAGSGTAGDGQYSFNVPVDQGIFVTDVDTLETRLIARTGTNPGDFLDFVYWNFSGKVPNDPNSDEGEPARWRSASFVAMDGWSVALKGDRDDPNSADPITGLYLDFEDQFLTVAEMGQDGGLIDPAAAGLPIVGLGIERDGYRNGWLSINASMADLDNGWAGIYVARVPEPGTLALLGLGLAGLFLRRRQA